MTSDFPHEAGGMGDGQRLILLERWRRTAELALERAQARATEAERASQELFERLAAAEAALDQAREHPQLLAAEIRRREAALVRARQEAYAERARRDELAEELGGLRERLEERGDEVRRAELELRAAELEREVERLQRALAEAQLEAALPRAAISGPELAPLPGPRIIDSGPAPLPAVVTEALGAEDAMRAARGRRIGPVRSDAASASARSASTAAGEAPAAGAIEPERLAAALERLRTSGHQREPRDVAGAASGPESSWLSRALDRILADDPREAGRIIIGLLRAQHLTWPGEVSYDLVLGVDGVIEVDVRGGATEVRRRLPVMLGGAVEPRALEAVAFRVEADLAALARFVLRGGRRGPFARAGAQLAAPAGSAAPGGEPLARLVRGEVDLRALIGAGVSLTPMLAMTLAAAMIEPGWARRELTLVHRGNDGSGHTLRVRAGQQPRASRGIAAGGATVIECDGGALLAVLADTPGTAFELTGDAEDLRAVRSWLLRAQEG